MTHTKHVKLSSNQPRLAMLGATLVVLSLGCGEASRPSGIGTANCMGLDCDADVPEGGTPDVVSDTASDRPSMDGDADSGDSPQDVMQEPYAGPVGTVRGTAFVSSPPTFPTLRSEEYPLYYPATVDVWAHGAEYVGSIDPATGFSVPGVPTGLWTFVVQDVDKQNGVLDSAIQVDVHEGDQSVDLPAVGKNSFVVIYGVLDPPVIRDPLLAQIVVSFERCAASGGERLVGAKLIPPAGAQTVVTHDGASWRAGTLDGTGANGVAIVANVPAEPYPGNEVTMSYTYEGENHPIPSFLVFRGGVSRVVVVHPC